MLFVLRRLYALSSDVFEVQQPCKGVMLLEEAEFAKAMNGLPHNVVEGDGESSLPSFFSVPREGYYYFATRKDCDTCIQFRRLVAL